MRPFYDRNGITIYHGDCRDVLPTLDADSVDLLLTDPPYDTVTHEGARTGKVDQPLITDFACTSAVALREIYGLAAPACRAWLVATMDWRHIGPLEEVPPNGWRFVRFGVWIKPNGAPQFTGDRPATGWEAIGFWHKANVPMRWNGGGSHAVFTYPKVEGQHPTGKPIRLIKRLVSLFSNPGDVVMDCFMGAGSTARACKDLGRNFVGIEIEERYCEIAARRLDQECFDFAALEQQP